MHSNKMQKGEKFREFLTKALPDQMAAQMKKEAFEAVRRRFTKKKETDSKEAIKRKEAESMK